MSDVLYDESRPKHYISLDLVNRSIEPIVHVVQTDDRIPIIVASITSGGKPWVIPEDVIAIEMYLRKSSGNIFWTDCLEVTEDRTTVLFEVLQRATSAIGKGSAMIKFTFANGATSTSPFVLQVDTNPIAGYNPEMDGNPDADVISAIRRLDTWLTKAQEQINEIIEHDKEDDRDIDQLQEDLKKLIAKTKEVDDQLTKALDDLRTVVSKKDEELEQKLNDLIRNTKDADDRLTEMIEQLESDMEKSDSQIRDSIVNLARDTSTSIKELQETITSSIDALRSDMEENDNKINKRIDNLSGTVNENQKNLIEQLQTTENSLNESIESLEKELKDKDKDLETKIQNEDKKLQDQISDLTQKYNDLPSMLVPAGSIIFENLPPLDEVEIGWMYNILNDFISTSDFEEGAGVRFPAGTNVYKDKNNLWDCMFGSSVLSVNGKTGNIIITADDLDLSGIGGSISDLKEKTESLDKRVTALEESGGGSEEIEELQNKINLLTSALIELSLHAIVDSAYEGIASLIKEKEDKA